MQMAAAAEEDVSALDGRIDELSVSATEDSEMPAAGRIDGNDVDVTARSCEPRLWGFETRELYKLALNFYKGERDTSSRRDHIHLDHKLNRATLSKILYVSPRENSEIYIYLYVYVCTYVYIYS